MSRQPLVTATTPNNEQTPFPPALVHAAPPIGDVKPGDYRPSYIKNVPDTTGSGSGVNSSAYSPPYISSGAASPRDNVSVSFPGAAGYGDHTTDYSTHSSNSQGISNSPWSRYPPSKQGPNISPEPNITINPAGRIQNNQFPMRGPQVVTQQPKSVSVKSASSEQTQEWSSGICQCCDGTNASFAICCCLPCFTCWLSDRMQEGCCMPLCVPMSAMALRMKCRYQYNIKGSIVGDFCASVWCCPCVLCQLKRELDYQETQSNSVITRQANFI